MYGNGFVVRKFYEITCLLETFIIITNSLRSNSVIIMNYAVRTSLRTSMNSCRVLLHTVLFIAVYTGFFVGSRRPDDHCFIKVTEPPLVNIFLQNLIDTVNVSRETFCCESSASDIES